MIAPIARRSFATASKAAAYQLQVGCLIQRNPICLQPLDSFQSAYQEYRLALQYEQSRNLLRIQPLGQAPSEQEIAASKAPTPQTQVAALCKQVEPFPATQELHRHDEHYAKQTGIQRKLHRKLYLVVRQSDGSWGLPSVGEGAEDTPLHVQAHALAQGQCGPEARLYVPGRAPIAVHQEAWPDRTRAPLGVNLFVWRAELYGGRFEPPGPKEGEHQWLTMEELEQSLPARLYASLRHCLSE